MGKHLKNALVVGGSSGLGLCLAKLLSKSYHVTVTGRTDPQSRAFEFYELDMGASFTPHALDDLLKNTAHPDLVVWAAGFYQEGFLSDLSDDDVDDMMNVGLRAPAMLLARVLNSQEESKKTDLIMIGSTSQIVPRQKEPVYAAVKAGAVHFAKSLSLDPHMGKVLVTAPSGMNTPLWRNHPRKDAESLLDPKKVAEKVLELFESTAVFQNALILRDPMRVQVLDELKTRPS